MKIPKTVSAAKATANKKNSTKSTGPKSPQGKFFASRNTTRHGMFASDMLLPGESEKEWEQLRNDMISSYGPVGCEELLQVEMICRDRWRLQRFHRAETGAIAKRLADHNPVAEMAASVNAPQYHQVAIDLAKLKKIELQVSSEGFASTENLNWLRKLPYAEHVKELLEFANTRPAEPAEDVPPNPDVAARTESPLPTSTENAGTSTEQELLREFFLKILHSLKIRITEQYCYHAQFLMQRQTAQRGSLHLPPETELDRLLRYEKHLLKNLHRDMNTLERMQRLRLGDEVRPPSARFD